MLAMLITLGLGAAALFALTSIAASFQRGLLALGSLRRELEACSDTRMLAMWSASTGFAPHSGRDGAQARATRRPARAASRLAPSAHRVAA